MFIEEYLVELRRERFAPGALLRYAHRVGARVRADWLANPNGVRSVWAVAVVYFAVAFVMLFVGHLRDESGHRLSGLNLPLMLTLARVSMVPGIAVFLVDRHFAWAFGVYVFASLTDVLDGWLARRWRQITPLGTLLDPLVDIVFNLTTLAGLAAANLLHAWVFWVAVLRYGILVVGAASLYLFVGPVRVRPTWFGRMTGVIMTCLVALFTLLVAVRGPLGAGLTRLTEIMLGSMLVATVFQVLVMGWYNLRLLTGAARQAEKVVHDVRWKP